MDTFWTQSFNASESVETRLREKWTELLAVAAEEVESGSNFFSLGGNSMLLLSLHMFMSQEFSISLTLPELLENAEFAAMVLLVETKVVMDDKTIAGQNGTYLELEHLCVLVGE